MSFIDGNAEQCPVFKLNDTTFFYARTFSADNAISTGVHSSKGAFWYSAGAHEQPQFSRIP
jgi:hypothetical protein